MNIKKIVSILLCTLAISSFTVIPTSAARSADCNNTQIDDKVQLFNKTKLKKLNWYILCAGFDNFITKDLMTLYQKLNNLIVSDISVANEINENSSGGNSNSIGSQLDNIFSFMDIAYKKYYTSLSTKSNLDDSKYYFTVNLNTKVRNLITRIDQVSSL